MTKSSNLSKKTYSPEVINIISNILSGAEKFKKDTDEILTEYGFLKSVEPEPKEIAYDIINNIFHQFHRVAIRLAYAHNQFIIKNEYDVQDLLHALLLQHFRDIRAEEYTPSYAGSSTRMDFLLKREKIVIEVKKTREGMTDKSLGNELIIDKAHYKKHPDCDVLFCFVYDPDESLKNPEGLEDDISDIENGFVTKVLIVPRR
jgi:hypothetical protein